jgi:F0F1-type ATP synthase delta subunit
MEEKEILKMIKTSEEKMELINIIEDMSANAFKKKLINNTQSLSPFSQLLSQEISKLIESKNLKSSVETEKYLDSLLETVRNIIPIRITIAIEPTQELIQSIKEWSVKNLSENVIFDFEVDPKILGGAIITNKKGSYSDLSLLKKINVLFQNQKDQLIRLL